MILTLYGDSMVYNQSSGTCDDKDRYQTFYLTVLIVFWSEAAFWLVIFILFCLFLPLMQCNIEQEGGGGGGDAGASEKERIATL